jgi:hypothetical protein
MRFTYGVVLRLGRYGLFVTMYRRLVAGTPESGSSLHVLNASNHHVPFAVRLRL